MTNLLERAINTDDPDIAAKIIQHALPAVGNRNQLTRPSSVRRASVRQ
jgi:hypothetical protein